MICDGGYNDWRCLCAPYKHQLEGTDMERWSSNLESVRKDVECVFGILKRRFLFLKHPIRIHDAKQINRAFITCCVLHNVLLDSDGYDDMTEEDVEGCHNVLEESAEEQSRRSGNAHGVAGVRSQYRNDRYNVDRDGPVGGGYHYVNDEEEAREYRERRDALIEHHMYIRANV